MNNLLRSEKGAFTLMAVMAASTIMTIVMSVFFAAERVEEGMVIRTEQDAKAFWLAEAAVERFRTQFRNGDAVSDTGEVSNFADLGGKIQYKWNRGVFPATLTATGTFNGITKTIELKQDMTSVLDYSYFDKGDPASAPSVGTFGNAVKIMPFKNLTLKGRIYSGADKLYLGSTNSNTTVTIDSSAKFDVFKGSGTGQIITNTDFMGNPMTGPNVPAEQKKLEEPAANLEKITTMFAGYAQKASEGGVNITNIGTAPSYANTNAAFTNQAYGKTVTVRNLDISQIGNGQWPANSLIYSEGPIMIKNADTLNSDIMIVSNGDIYIKGDFNEAGTRGAVLMTSGRVFYLSDSFDTASTATSYADRQAAADGNNMTVDAALIDGTPSFCSSNWVTNDFGTVSKADDRYLANGGGGLVFGTNPTATAPVGNSNPCGLGFLENWTSATATPLTLAIRGNLVHLRNAEMEKRDLNNNGRDDSTNALLYTDANGDGIDDNTGLNIPLEWIVARSYNPPENRTFEYVTRHTNGSYKDLLPKIFAWREK